MSENQAHAGTGPAPLPASAGREEKDFTDKHVVPAVTRLHNALASCEALIAKCAERAAFGVERAGDGLGVCAVAVHRVSARRQGANLALIFGANIHGMRPAQTASV
jgi:hypothetical protein